MKNGWLGKKYGPRHYNRIPAKINRIKEIKKAGLKSPGNAEPCIPIFSIYYEGTWIVYYAELLTY